MFTLMFATEIHISNSSYSHLIKYLLLFFVSGISGRNFNKMIENILVIYIRSICKVALEYVPCDLRITISPRRFLWDLFGLNQEVPIYTVIGRHRISLQNSYSIQISLILVLLWHLFQLSNRFDILHGVQHRYCHRALWKNKNLKLRICCRCTSFKELRFGVSEGHHTLQQHPNIGWGNGFAPSGNKPKSETMLTQICAALWRY